MIIDTSAIVAILNQEPEAKTFARAIEAAGEVTMSAVSWVEASVVVDSAKDPIASRRFDQLIDAAQIRIEPVTQEQAQLARQAYRDFGKGSGHPAGLNFGDCFSYALARVKAERLLFKGNDFGKTDLNKFDR